ncbi:MAG: hypothetical protein A4E64_01135 [Syntrophorhabdus sp. PtaU1.Bin058]|nr:MAG: hypothetical protein A4E64_01135 [Syntrophorhabdus sp. PtaU1.Bin058]
MSQPFSKFVASPGVPVIWTIGAVLVVLDGSCTISAAVAATRPICPTGLEIMPLFSTVGATRKTEPISSVSMVPWFDTTPGVFVES